MPNSGNVPRQGAGGDRGGGHCGGTTILIADIAQDASREAACLAWLRNGRADGVFLMSRPEDDWSAVAPLPDTGMAPVVLISEPPAPRFSASTTRRARRTSPST